VLSSSGSDLEQMEEGVEAGASLLRGFGMVGNDALIARSTRS
jgi:hypothetical protein